MEEAERRAAEAEARRKEEEEAAARKKAEEEEAARRKAEEEEAERKRKEEEERWLLAEEAAKALDVDTVRGGGEAGWGGVGTGEGNQAEDGGALLVKLAWFISNKELHFPAPRRRALNVQCAVTYQTSTPGR